MLKLDIVREATRLTHSGHLVEATALLQRMLRGENAPDVAAPGPHRSTATEREPPTVDTKAHATEARSSRRTVRPPGDFTKNLPGLGLGGSLKRAQPSMREIVPDGAKFVEGSYGNAAGSRAYRLFIPSGYHGQAIPLVIMLHGCTQSPEDFAAGTR
jgi:Esterase PHB depolymerase